MKAGYRWYWRFPGGGFYALGPTEEYHTTERAARQAIREAYGLSRLPRNTECWHATNDQGRVL